MRKPRKFLPPRLVRERIPAAAVKKPPSSPRHGHRMAPRALPTAVETVAFSTW
jgi:hypothetical protein